MTIFTTTGLLDWGALDLPLQGLNRDWHGAPVTPPAGFCLAQDPLRLWFVAHHRKPAAIHPAARPGKFQPELWRHDVAELFLADPVSGRYLELNLAPNGSWWSCEFTAPRVRAEAAEVPMPEVATFADLSPDGSWVAAMAIPIELLRARINYGPETRSNVAMILNSPAQIFVSATPPAPGEPDFHRMMAFEKTAFVPLPAG